MTTIQRRSRNSGPALGQDAFLDIVANLVGILIILVVIVGSRSHEMAEAVVARSKSQQSDSSTPIDESQLKQKVESYETELSRARSAQEESVKLEATLKQTDAQLALMDQERGKFMDLIALAREAWEEKKKELDQSTVARAEALSEVSAAESQLKQLEATRTRLEKTPEQVVAVQHLPTPMAKTVFGEELHFRLKAGRLAVVPIDRLIHEIKSDFQRSAAGNREGIMEAVVGPIQGFVARYEMNKSRELVSQGGQTSMATRIELVNMIVEPLSEPSGLPINDVIQGDGTQLDIELAGRQPDRTTITVWVYPDSFAEFRRLKEHLYSRGFATAARPLPMDMPISGGPQGSRSRAQ